MKFIVQLLGLTFLIPAVAMGALRYKYSDADGPSILFPGGELISGSVYNGPEPDWSFTANIPTIELQLSESKSSRYVWAIPVNGRLYVVSSYMSSVIGRTWKHWAIEATEGDGAAIVRVNGVRYQRHLTRVFQGFELDGVANVLSSKYNFQTTRQDIESGNTWVFRAEPPEQTL